MLQSVIVYGAVIYHIYNANGVLQYTRITALYNTSVIFLAVQNNYLQGQICLSPILRLIIIITKPFPTALMLSPFGFHGDIRRRVAPWSARPSAPRTESISIENIAHRLT